MAITFLPLISDIICLSLSSNGTDPSITYKIRSACDANFSALSTPIFSTISSVSRIPAVSTMFSIIPFMLTTSSKVSLVVPAISVTIALFSPRNMLRSEDFPAFGLPTITVLIPSFKILPLSKVCSNLSTLSPNLSTIVCSFCG